MIYVKRTDFLRHSAFTFFFATNTSFHLSGPGPGPGPGSDLLALSLLLHLTLSLLLSGSLIPLRAAPSTQNRPLSSRPSPGKDLGGIPPPDRFVSSMPGPAHTRPWASGPDNLDTKMIESRVPQDPLKG